MIDGPTPVSLIADKGYNNDAFRAHLAGAEIDAVVLPCAQRQHDLVEVSVEPPGRGPKTGAQRLLQ